MTDHASEANQPGSPDFPASETTGGRAEPASRANSPPGQKNQSPSSQPGSGDYASSTRGRLFRLTLKELREILRDRRTIITLVLMPLLVYPVLGVVFQKFMLTLPRRHAQYLFGVESRWDEQVLAQFFSPANQHLQRLRNEGRWPLPLRESGSSPPMYEILPPDGISLEQRVSEGVYHLGLRSRLLEPLRNDGSVPRLEIELIYQRDSAVSVAAVEYLQDRLAAWDDYVREQQRQSERSKIALAAGVAARWAFDAEAGRRRLVSTRYVNVESQIQVSTGVSLASVIPLILILMTITGAVYPAIDLTAGERERGTLEALVAAPLPRMALLFGKYVAVVTVAMLTAIVNLVAMTTTVRTVGLSMALFGAGGLSFGTIATVFALLMLFAVFFSAVLLAVTSFARSFKEAQAYLIPLMLLALAPGVMSLVPGVTLSGPLAVAPLINMVLLARDVFAGTAQLGYAVVAVLSTVIYSAATLALAARIFGTDAILYGSYGTWGEMLQRPAAFTDRPTVPMAMFCLAILFPLFFMSGGMLRGDGTWSAARQMALSAIFTAVLFGGLPLLLAWWRRLRLETTFAWWPAPPLAYVAAVILGLTLWPAAHEAYWLSKAIGLASLDSDMMTAVEKALGRWAEIPTWLVFAALAFAPAIFEEICFRGFVFQSLLGKLSVWSAILASAALFGAFHVLVNGVLAIERLLPTTLLGVVLAWVAWRSGSIKPGIVLHVCHNGLIAVASLYQQGRFNRLPRLESALEWLGLKSLVVERDVHHLPVACLLLGVVGPALGMWLFTRIKSPPQESPT